MNIPDSLVDAVHAHLGGEIPVRCGNASVEAVVMETDEAPASERAHQMAEQWIAKQIPLHRTAGLLAIELVEKYPVDIPNSIFPEYWSKDWWMELRYWKWSATLDAAIEAGQAFLDEEEDPLA